MDEPALYRMPDGRSIAYHRGTAQAASAGSARPGIVFLPGFRSDMCGNKALFLGDWAAGQGRGFLRFDYTGHGESSGAFADGCIGDWFRDAGDVLRDLTTGPQVLVGSSMGGWIALLLMRAMPERVAGLVGIAAAPDFTEESMWRRMTAAQRDTLRRDGRIEQPSDYAEEPYPITRRLIEDGRRHLVLRAPLPAPCPVRLLHGMDDVDVPWETAARLAAHIEGDDVRTTLIRSADHRLSTERDLALLAETVHTLPDPRHPGLGHPDPGLTDTVTS